jgi:hypothetical protein
MLCCIIQKLRYVVTLLTLIINGPDTDYYILTEHFKVSRLISDMCNKTYFNEISHVICIMTSVEFSVLMAASKFSAICIDLIDCET